MGAKDRKVDKGATGERDASAQPVSVAIGDGFDTARLVNAVAEALVLADPGDIRSLEALTTAARSLAQAGKKSNAAWAREAAAIMSDARRLGARTDPAQSLPILSARLGKVQAMVLMPASEASLPMENGRGSGPSHAANPGGPDSTVPSLADDPELKRDFVARATEHLEAADEGLLLLEREPGDAEALNSVFRAFHTIKGMAGFLSLSSIEQLSHDTETLLEGPRRGTSRLEPSDFDRVFRATDSMKRLVSEVLSPPTRPQEYPPQAPAAAPRAAKGSVRIDEERLDRLLETVGELVIAESGFSEAIRGDGDIAALAPRLARLDKITRELQEMSTSLRMVPLRSTFVRMGRVVRDTARRKNKAVEFVTEGAETELDKLVVDRIWDPLVHLLRNAVDHGIETPREREGAGKPETGRVQLRAYHAGGRVHIEVSDDGRGLDVKAIATSARRRGLLGDEEPDERRLVDLIFQPGFSTAEKVTDVSGRGVGMDVVRKTIEALRGDIEVTTAPGSGTLVSIRLPLTLAIIDGMVVRVGAERYIVPTVAIERSLRPSKEHLTNVLGRRDAIAVGDELLPLISLSELFEVEGARSDPSRSIVVVLTDNGDRVGVTADEILGQQQTVIKPLSEGLHNVTGVAGGAIMPDGRIGLILDVGGLVRLAREKEVWDGETDDRRDGRREVLDLQSEG